MSTECVVEPGEAPGFSASLWMFVFLMSGTLLPVNFIPDTRASHDRPDRRVNLTTLIVSQTIQEMQFEAHFHRLLGVGDFLSEFMSTRPHTHTHTHDICWSVTLFQHNVKGDKLPLYAHSSLVDWSQASGSWGTRQSSASSRRSHQRAQWGHRHTGSWEAQTHMQTLNKQESMNRTFQRKWANRRNYNWWRVQSCFFASAESHKRPSVKFALAVSSSTTSPRSLK